ncbi:hypothetical protein ASPCADRAFT_206902 [Aspergillus carbonarius ITEM 5010]|uniref:Uncharacterized protein n=1 Tax=Aspergillus carbonarius (strain ITEM 5010) TaxID=602072 RepID=A0A1R3RQF7_ASPC5|nr:hypothetical protein ASPCADRAFT_206902 [Aspergillus carbonarius ITEM 5010]
MLWHQVAGNPTISAGCVCQPRSMHIHNHILPRGPKEEGNGHSKRSRYNKETSRNGGHQAALIKSPVLCPPSVDCQVQSRQPTCRCPELVLHQPG